MTTGNGGIQRDLGRLHTLESTQEQIKDQLTNLKSEQTRTHKLQNRLDEGLQELLKRVPEREGSEQ